LPAVSQTSRSDERRRRYWPRLEAEQARGAAGLSITFAVLQAQRDLATAQTNELRAQLDYRRALVDFDLAREAV
jgi:outer membrane protein TolC